MLRSFANEMDKSDVDLSSHSVREKSIGNYWTTPKNITNFQEAKIVLKVLSESVALRLRDKSLKGRVVALYVRDKKLHGFTRKIKIDSYTDVAKDIHKQAVNLLYGNYEFRIAIRSIGVTVSSLTSNTDNLQFDFLRSHKERDRTRT